MISEEQVFTLLDELNSRNAVTYAEYSFLYDAFNELIAQRDKALQELTCIASDDVKVTEEGAEK